MQIHISPRDVKLTAAIHGHIAQKLEHLEHFTDRLIGAHVAIFHDSTRANKHAFVVKIHLAVPGPDLHAEDHGHDLYQAIDLAVKRLEKQLRKKKTAVTQRRRLEGQKAKVKRSAVIV